MGFSLLLSLVWARRTRITLLSYDKDSIPSGVGSLELIWHGNSLDKDASDVYNTHTCTKVEISNGINQSGTAAAFQPFKRLSSVSV